MKKPLKGQRIKGNEELQETAHQWMCSTFKDLLHKNIRKYHNTGNSTIILDASSSNMLKYNLGAVHIHDYIKSKSFVSDIVE